MSQNQPDTPDNNRGEEVDGMSEGEMEKVAEWSRAINRNWVSNVAFDDGVERNVRSPRTSNNRREHDEELQ